MPCKFISQLSKLRKLSAESVENTNSFDQFKEYLHVEREVEEQLRYLLRDINKNQSKCLVLLCGSAGDGKSHLISYLKNNDSENLLEEFEPYNDATESSQPTLTSIDTLAEKLRSFDDDHYFVEDGKKIIVAINLGTLNNFIDSEKGKAFSKLRNYVLEHGILSGQAEETGYQNASVFQHVSFSDYQIFSLCDGKIKTVFLEKVFEKIFDPSDKNPFYKTYEEECSCPLCIRCPVRHNYEFLSNTIHQKAIINRIVETIIKDKTIVSTRDVLNLIFDLIVHPDFDKNKIGVGVSDIEYLSNYLAWTTPMLLNEYEDISPLLNMVRKHDLLQRRSSGVDENVMTFHSLECIDAVFKEVSNGTPYIKLCELANLSQLGVKKPEIKKRLYKFIARLSDLRDSTARDGQQKKYNEYVQYLYFQNSGAEQKLGRLYEATQNAIMNWDGCFSPETICIDDSNDHFWVLEQLKLNALINENAPRKTGDLHRFSTVLNLLFESDTLYGLPPVEISIDYSLFELITEMQCGYRPTVNDKNMHANFVSFVQRLIELGDKARRIVLIPRDSDSRREFIFEKTAFGYKFRAVK